MGRHRIDTFYARFGKRVMDVLIAVAALAACLPLMLLLAAATLIASGPPVFFVQERVGRFGNRFPLIKFRTMVPGAESGGWVTVAGDSRVTGIGRVMRKWKLDELPQLWNVLRGDMSLVGPRPDVPEVMDRLPAEGRLILSVRPGITGPATLIFRKEEVLLAAQADPQRFTTEVLFPEKVRINQAYLQELSLRTDVFCLLQTIAGFIGES